jgi:hypothetical protein
MTICSGIRLAYLLDLALQPHREQRAHPDDLPPDIKCCPGHGASSVDTADQGQYWMLYTVAISTIALGILLATRGTLGLRMPQEPVTAHSV